MRRFPRQPPTLMELERDKMAETANNFALRLYETVSAGSGNLMVCPLSAAVLLALTRHGAAGSTAEQLTSALRLPADRQQTADGYRALMDALQVQDAVLNIANKMYVQTSFKLKDSFRQTAVECFRADAEEVDFEGDTQKARNAINQWAEERTERKIKDLFAEGILDQSTRLVLVNAIYFKGRWVEPFDNTKNEPFHVSESLEVSVPTMHGEFQIEYGEIPHLDSAVVSLPYISGEADLHMLILLPNSVNGLPKLEEGLDKVDFGDLFYGYFEVNLSLPKFKINSEHLLKENLKQLGVKEIFDESADLSNMADKGLYVGDVVQKTFIDVDEKGTEAAAATGEFCQPISEPPIAQFNANHPFLFIIRSGGTFLFLGRVTDPSN